MGEQRGAGWGATPDPGTLLEHGTLAEPGTLDEPLDALPRDGLDTLLPSVERSMLSRRQSSSSVRAGDVIGERYVVEGALGHGGMGRVLRVRHQALGKSFALKVMRTQMALDPRIREMFYREARLASALAHDNICTIVDFGEDEAFGLFMVMELLDGQTVHARLRTGRMSPKVACDVLWQVADAVRFIHGRSILHGDLKSDNVLLVRSASNRRLAKLLDFGLASPAMGNSRAGGGTPEYLAPERAQGQPASVASDIYALGILMFEMFTGRLPFTGDGDEVMRMQRDVPVPAPSSQIDEPLDERADAIVARATAKDPAQRHPDASALMYELRTLMSMLGAAASGRRRAVSSDGGRDRREQDSHKVKAAAEIFATVPLPMAACDAKGRVRAANPAFLSFLGAAGEALGLELRDSALPEVYPTLFADLAQVVATRLPVKRVVALSEGGDRIVEAAVVLTPAASSAEVTAGEVLIVLHPLGRSTT